MRKKLMFLLIAVSIIAIVNAVLKPFTEDPPLAQDNTIYTQNL